MEWPAVAVVVVTYNRVDILAETLRALMDHLHYSGPLSYVIADDGSDDGTHGFIQDLDAPQLVVSRRAGLGANTNAGLRYVFDVLGTAYVLQLQDDMRLLAPLDLHAHVERLARQPLSGYIRLWGVCGHRYQATLDGSYWRIAWESPELYIPSDRPHVKHRRFHDVFGYYPEGLTTAVTEDAWCHACKDVAQEQTAAGREVPFVEVPQAETERTWEHIGWHNRWRDKGL